jgi:hypothetical protein
VSVAPAREAAPRRALVAYFSMEVALENDIPTYSGGLGVLAGDTLRSAADLGLPVVAVTLLHRKGHFFQRLDADGRQREEPVAWPVDDLLQALDSPVSSTWKAGRSPSGRGATRWPGPPAPRFPWSCSTPMCPGTIPGTAG